MNIKLKSLTLQNFKGIRSLEVSFEDQTTISADNGLGKTTIFDAFTWLLFGKDSRGSADFGIKTIENGKVIEKIDHSVTGVLCADGVDMVLGRTYAEKWQRRRGSEEAEMTGHETSYTWDGVPVQAGEYQKRVSQIVDENLFRLLTSSTYFNSMKWQDRRKVLIDMAGIVMAGDVMADMDKNAVDTIKQLLGSGKSLDDHRKQIAVAKKGYKDELALIPARIDEVKMSLPEATDYEQIKKELYADQVALLEVENAISDQVKAHADETKLLQEKQNEIYKMKSRLQQIEFETEQDKVKYENDRQIKANQLKRLIAVATSDVLAAKVSIKELSAKIEVSEKKVADLRTEFAKVSEEVLVFKDGEFNCPACGRELEPDTINTRKEVMIADFDKKKGIRLTAIRADGTSLNTAIQSIRNEITLLNGKIESAELGKKHAEAELATLEAAIAPAAVLPPEHAELSAAIATAELSVMAAPTIDIEGLKLRKAELQADIERLKALAATEDRIRQGKARIKELSAQEKELAQKLSDLEKQEFAIAQYVQKSMDMVEQRVNEKFRLVQWKMFDQQINGGVSETCEAMVAGVPYSDINSAARIQAGIDCINTLSNHYGIYAPVWIDNAESINDIPPTVSQQIRLVVSKEQSLTIK